jgi:hypothetical protein
MRLVRFVCVATAHATGRKDSALTIHEGAWAFCASGGAEPNHEWRPSEGLPLSETMRSTPRQMADSAPSAAPAARGKARQP